AALAAARLAGCPLWLHIQDFEVGAAQSTGMLRGGLARRVASSWEKWCLGKCQRVSTISGPMLELLSAKDVANTRRVFLPNWADIERVYPTESQNKLRKELGLSPDEKVVLYAGNM